MEGESVRRGLKTVGVSVRRAWQYVNLGNRLIGFAIDVVMVVLFWMADGLGEGLLGLLWLMVSVKRHLLH